VASVGDYIYAKSEDALWVNLFIGSKTKFQMGKVDVPMEMTTNYPLDGLIQLTLNPEQKARFSVKLRLPGWAKEEPVPGGLYRFAGKSTEKFTLLLNGKAVPYTEENGYLTITRTWEKGDQLQYSLPMDVRKLVARQEVTANEDRIAIQRGPLVYCVEGADNNGKAWNILIPENATFTVFQHQVLDEKVMAVQAEMKVMTGSEDGSTLQAETKKIIAIPYYTWANRGQNEMQVWLPTKIQEVKIIR
jgi:DUF1680 family protein